MFKLAILRLLIVKTSRTEIHIKVTHCLYLVVPKLVDLTNQQ